jgi:hypothetical protein
MDDPNSNCCADCDYFLKRVYRTGMTDRKCLIDNSALLDIIIECNFYETKLEKELEEADKNV